MRSLCSPRMRAPTVAAILTAALLPAGCGGGDDKPEKPPGRVQEVTDTINLFERATAHRDYDRICNDLFSEAVRRHAGGKRCPKLLAETSADVRRPHIDILKITIDGNRAKARVRTRASGQEAVTETLQLVREDGRYRVSALSR
jgi:limonene-1,2-epoxide hydrolase